MVNARVSTSWEQRLQNENYKNWLKVGYGLSKTCNGIQPFIEREAKAFHASLIAKLHGLPPCTCTHTPGRRPNPYHDMSSCKWAKELESHHIKRRPTWSQSDGLLWTDPNVGYWEIAKLYMPFGCANRKVCAVDTDATGLLNLLIWCSHYKTDATLVNKVKETRNAWAHEPTQELDAVETTDAFLTMKDFLQDAELIADVDAKDALNQITTLESDALIDFEELETKLVQELRQSMTSMKDELAAKLDSMKDQEDFHANEIKEEIYKINGILAYCMKVGEQRDSVLFNMQNQMDFLIQSIARLHGKKEEISGNKGMVEATTSSLKNIAWLPIIVYLRLPRAIPRKVLLVIFILSHSCILEERFEEIGCTARGKSEDPFELLERDFSAYLNRAREGFVGRQWLFKDLSDTLNQTESNGVMIIGAPGFGKSALIANLICSKLSSSSLHSQILGYHLCIHSYKITQNGAKFVRNLANMIASKLKDYGDLVKRDKSIQKVLSDYDSCLSDPSGCFEQVIVSPLSRLRLQLLNPTMYIIVDALDECHNDNELDKGTSIVNILSQNIKLFPSWLKIILTSRDETNIRRKFSGLEIIELHPDDPRNLLDIERFIKSKLQYSFFSHMRSYSIEDFSIQAMVNKSQGNFLYIKLVLEYLQKKGVSAASWNSLPKSIDSIYQEFFERRFNAKKFRGARKIFEVLVATLSPLTREELYNVLLTEFEDPDDYDFEYNFLPVLGDLSMYLSNTQENQVVTVFHNSLTEWLTSSSNRGGIFYVDKKKGSRLLADYNFKKMYGKFIIIGPEFVYNLATYVVKGLNTKLQINKFNNLDQKLLRVADNNTKITALHIAASEDKDSKILELFLYIFKDVDVEDKNGRTPAFLAAKFNRLNNLRLLHKRGASLVRITSKLSCGNLNLEEDDLQFCKQQMCGYSSLHVASQKGHEQIVEYLLQNQVNVSTLSGTGNSAIHLAAEYGHFEIVKTLIKHGAVPDSRCLYYAAVQGNALMVHYLLKKGVKDTCMDCRDMFNDDSKGQLVRFHNFDDRYKYRKHCNTALHIAAIKNFPGVAEVLLKTKNNAAHCINYFGKDPLLEAIHHNNFKVIKMLLVSGANISSFCMFDARDSSCDFCPCGYTPLHLAAHYGFDEIMKLLLQYNNADYNATDCKGLQPIHVASCHGHKAILSILVEHGADVNSKGPNDMTPMHYACKCQAIGLFNKLFDLGAIGTARTLDGNTPIHYIVQKHFIDEEFSFIDPYVSSPIDPIDMNDQTTIERQFNHKYPWMVCLNAFLVSFSKSNSSDLNSVFDLSLRKVFIGIIEHVLKSMLGNTMSSNWKFAALTSPLYYAYDLGVASHFQKHLNKMESMSVAEKALFKTLNRGNTDCSHLVSHVEMSLIYKLDTLLGLGYDINCHESPTSSPLFVYLRQGGRNMAKVLAKHNVITDIQCGENFENSVFHLAAYHKLHYLQYISVFRDPVKWERYLKEENSLFDYLFDEYEKKTVEEQVKVTRARDGPVAKAIKSHPLGHKIIDECLDREGYTALHRAAQGGNVVAVKHFLNWGANITRESPEGFSLLVLSVWYAVKYRPYLNFHKPSFSTSLEIELASLTASAILHHLTEEKPFDIGCHHNKKTPTLLHLAATRGMWRFIEDLFKAKHHLKVTGLTANCPTTDNITPMYLAKLYGGDDCDWDNPWCKVVGILLKYGASMIYPDQATEYFLVFNFLFHELPGRLDLFLDKEELNVLSKTDRKTFEGCISLFNFLISIKEFYHYFNKLEESVFQTSSGEFFLDNVMIPLLKAEENFEKTKDKFDNFLTSGLSWIKFIFAHLKDNDDATLRCVTKKYQRTRQITYESKLVNQKEKELKDKYLEQLLIRRDQRSKIQGRNRGSTEYDETIQFPSFVAEDLDMCSSKPIIMSEILHEYLKKNRRIFINYYKLLNKKMKITKQKKEHVFQQYDFESLKSDLFLVKVFNYYQRPLNCRLEEATYKYANLKFLLHTLKFWNTQVQKMLFYPSISKFVSKRIQDVFLNENEKEITRLILKLADEESLSNYEYLKMLRFTKPPMFDRTIKYT